MSDPRCATCGHPRSNHPYRHPFAGPSEQDIITALLAERDAWKARAEAAEENVGILQARREALEAQVAQLQRELAKARGLGPRAKAEARVAELELLAKGQEEQLEIQGNALIRMNNRATEQTARAEAAEAALPRAWERGRDDAADQASAYMIKTGFFDANMQAEKIGYIIRALPVPADLAKGVADE